MMKVGMTGSVAHVLSNNKIENKGACIADLTKQGLKDTVTLTATGAAAAGVAAGGVAALSKLSTVKNAKVAELAQKGMTAVTTAATNVKSKVGNALANVSVKGTNLNDAVKNSSIFKKFSALPTPAKAAIAAGAAALAIVTPLLTIGSASKAGYIEAQHETK